MTTDNTDYKTLMEMNSGLLYSFEYFYHMDMANAAIHMSHVRFSPITFQISGFLAPTTENIKHVKSHIGKYPLDIGR
jgi:hypothetical protein